MCCTCWGNLFAQSDSIALPELFASWEKQKGIYVAYDATRHGALKVHARQRKARPKIVFREIKTRFDLCFTAVDSAHFLLQDCPFEPWELQGEVVDAQTGESLPFSNVRLLGSKRGAVTDESGRFRLSGIESAKAAVEFRYIGYATDTVAVSTQRRSCRVALRPKAYALADVEIAARMDLVRLEDDFGAVAIETDRLPALPSIAGPDPLNSIRLLPGIGGNPESGAGIVMRGSKYDQTMLLYDQVPLLHMNHFFGLFSSIDQRSVKDIRVFRSGYSAKYSGYTGGMIQITGREGDLEKVRGSVEMDRFTTGARVEIPIIRGKWSSALTYRQDNAWIGPDRWNDLVTQNLIREFIVASTPVVRADVARSAAYFFRDITAKSVFRLNDRHRFTAGFQSSGDDVSNDVLYADSALGYQLDLDFQSLWRNLGGYVRWDHQIGANWDGSLQGSLAEFFSSTTFDPLLEIRNGDTLQNIRQYDLDNYLWQARIRYDLERTASKGRKWLLGAEFPLLTARVDLTETPEFAGPDTSAVALSAVYAEHLWPLGRWHLRTGFRLVADPLLEDLYPEPRLALRYRISESARWRLNYGMYNQHARQYLPAVREGLVPDFWLLPDNIYTPVQWAQMLATGLAYTKKDFLLDAEIYGKEIRNTIEQFPELARLYPTDSTFLSAFAKGRSTVVGLDLMVSQRFRHLTVWSGGDLIRTRNRATALSEVAYQPFYANFGSVKAGLLLTWKNWELGLTWRWQGGRRTTLVAAVPAAGQVPAGNVTFPDYHRLDAALTWRFRFKGVEGFLQNSFFNLYNRRNLRNAQYTFGQGGTLNRVESANLPFLYNLKLSVSF